tara:strand:+ start:184 stop:390 length:207 start_codon:yes stop_codon:yes gene_type:complete
MKTGIPFGVLVASGRRIQYGVESIHIFLRGAIPFGKPTTTRLGHIVMVVKVVKKREGESGLPAPMTGG